MSRSNSHTALKPTLTSPPTMEGQPSTVSNGFPRSSTRTSLHRSVSGPAPSPSHNSISLHRLKSFFHLPSLPFRSSSDRPLDEGAADDSSGGPQPSAEAPPIILGPRKGEIQVINYDAIADLARMGMVSDHRPVYAVVAIGIGGEPFSA